MIKNGFPSFDMTPSTALRTETCFILHGSAEKQMLDYTDYNQAFTASIEDIRDSYIAYRRRYEQWRS